MTRLKGKPSLPLWKAILWSIYFWIVFTGFIWTTHVLSLGKKPLDLSEVILGGVFFPLYLWAWWAAKKKNLWSWSGLLSILGFFTYMSLLLWYGALRFLLRLLSPSWTWIFITLHIIMLCMGLLTFFVRPKLFKSLFEKGLKAFFLIGILFGGGSGTKAAVLGMYAARRGHYTFLSSLLAFVFWGLGTVIFFWIVFALYYSRALEDKGGTDDALASDGYLWDRGRLAGHVVIQAKKEVKARQDQVRARLRAWLSAWFRRKRAWDELLRGTWQAMTGEYAKAVKTLSKALKRDPHLGEAYLHRGIAYLEMDRVEETLQDLDRAVKLLPQEPMAYYNRALAWMAREDWGRAEADLEQAVDLAPEDAEAWNLLAIVRSQAGKVEEALEAIQQAIALGHPEGWRNRAIILEEAGRLDEALAAWETYARQGKREAVYARARRGLLLWQMGREAEAQEEVAWAWKHRRKLDPFIRERLQKVHREMQRKARTRWGG